MKQNPAKRPTRSVRGTWVRHAGPYFEVKLERGSDELGSMLVRTDGSNCMNEMTGEKAAEVVRSEAVPGWGPLLYDYAALVATNRYDLPLVSDRYTVSAEAAGVWAHYFDQRWDVPKIAIDPTWSCPLGNVPDFGIRMPASAFSGMWGVDSAAWLGLKRKKSSRVSPERRRLMEARQRLAGRAAANPSTSRSTPAGGRNPGQRVRGSRTHSETFSMPKKRKPSRKPVKYLGPAWLNPHARLNMAGRRKQAGLKDLWREALGPAWSQDPEAMAMYKGGMAPDGTVWEFEAGKDRVAKKRRQTKARVARKSSRAPAASEELRGMSREELVAAGTASAIAELARRGRGADGRKLGKGIAAQLSKAVANPRRRARRKADQF